MFVIIIIAFTVLAFPIISKLIKSNMLTGTSWKGFSWRCSSSTSTCRRASTPSITSTCAPWPRPTSWLSRRCRCRKSAPSSWKRWRRITMTSWRTILCKRASRDGQAWTRCPLTDGVLPSYHNVCWRIIGLLNRYK